MSSEQLLPQVTVVELNDDSRSILQQAELCIRKREFEQAEQLLLQLMQDRQLPPQDYPRLAHIATRLKHWEVLQQTYQYALTVDADPALWFQLAIAHERTQNWQAAKDAYQQALDAGYITVKVYYRLAMVCTLLNLEEESLLNYQRALPYYSAEEKNALSAVQNMPPEAKNTAPDFNFYNEWITILIRCGFYRDALTLLLRTLPVTQAHAGLDKLIRKLFWFLPTHGLLKEGLLALLLLRSIPQLTETANELFLDMCVRFGYFGDESRWLADQVISESKAFSTALKHAFYLSVTLSGLDATLLNKLLDVSVGQKMDPKFLYTLACALFRLKDYERLQLLLRHQNTVVLNDCVEDIPAIAWYVLQQSDTAPELAQKANITLHSYACVQETQADVWQRVYAVSSLAIVGNSSCEIGQGCGAAIDRHDAVIRFNNFNTAAPYDADYGSKVSLHVRPGADVEKYDITPPEVDVVLSGIQPWVFFHRWSTASRLLAKGTRLAFFPEQEQTALLRHLKRAPSAGMTTVWICAQHHAVAASAYYGFQFTDQCGERAKSAHYWEDSKPSPRHGWDEEYAVFQQVTGKQLPLIAQPAQRLNIKFVGDHSEYHGGCAAVTDYMVKLLQPAGQLVTHDDYDVLVINGEGSMHHNSSHFKQKMNELGQAVGRGKPAYLVNSVWQENAPSFADIVVGQLGRLVFREQASQNDFLQRLSGNTAVRLDVSYSADIDESAVFTDYQRDIVLTDFYSTEFGNFVRYTGGYLTRYPYLDMMSGISWSSMVKSLRTASVLVTGRHHAVYAACRARTPFVTLKGNTHKIEGMIQMSGLPIPVYEKPQQIGEGIRWARRNKAVYEAFFDWMDAQPRLTLADLDLTPQL